MSIHPRVLVIDDEPQIHRFLLPRSRRRAAEAPRSSAVHRPAEAAR